MKEQIVLIGFGAIGIPIAWHMNQCYGDQFALVATGHRRQKMEKKHYWVNGTAFSPEDYFDCRGVGGKTFSCDYLCEKL